MPKRVACEKKLTPTILNTTVNKFKINKNVRYFSMYLRNNTHLPAKAISPSIIITTEIIAGPKYLVKEP